MKVARSIYCTIVTARRFPQALELIASLRRYQPKADARILVQEHPLMVARLRARVRDVAIVAPDEIDGADWLQRAFIFDEVDYARALRPALLQQLAKEGAVLEIDADTEVVAPPASVDELMGAHDLVVVARSDAPARPLLIALRPTETLGAALAAWRVAAAAGGTSLDPSWLVDAVDDAEVARRCDWLRPVTATAARNGGSARLDGVELNRYSFDHYVDSNPVAERHRRIFAHLAGPNRRRILNPFAVSAEMHKIVAASEEDRPPPEGAIEERIDRPQRQLYVLPQSFVSRTGTIIGAISPRAKDRIWNALQSVSKALGAAGATSEGR